MTQLSPDPINQNHNMQKVNSGKKLVTQNFAAIKAKLEAKYNLNKNEVEDNEDDEFVQIRDRKLSHQVISQAHVAIKK